MTWCSSYFLPRKIQAGEGETIVKGISPMPIPLDYRPENPLFHKRNPVAFKLNALAPLSSPQPSTLTQHTLHRPSQRSYFQIVQFIWNSLCGHKSCHLMSDNCKPRDTPWLCATSWYSVMCDTTWYCVILLHVAMLVCIIQFLSNKIVLHSASWYRSNSWCFVILKILYYTSQG